MSNRDLIEQLEDWKAEIHEWTDKMLETSDELMSELRYDSLECNQELLENKAPRLKEIPEKLLKIKKRLEILRIVPDSDLEHLRNRLREIEQELDQAVSIINACKYDY